MKQTDVGHLEHLGLLAGGATLLAIGLSRGGVGGLAAKLGGAALLCKGAKDFEPIRTCLGMKKGSRLSEISHEALRVESSIDVDRSPEDLYELWRDFENLPGFMSNVLEVDAINSVQSHWMVRGPGHTVVQWDAEVIRDEPNELIAWQTIAGSAVDHAGSVHFERLENGKTRIRVVLRYELHPGGVGNLVARLARLDPQRQVDEDLNRFKRILEGFAKLENRTKVPVDGPRPKAKQLRPR